MSAFAGVMEELTRLLPPGADVIDAHTHLGADEDGQSLTRDELLAHLDVVGPGTRACTFPLHDPDRDPAYRVPNDRVLEWARDSGGRIIPYCRLDPADDPLGEAERCLALGARGIKLHPRAQAFAFTRPEMDGIFAIAAGAGVPILVHAGRGMAPMDALADVALRHTEVPLVLAHAAIAGQGMFAERLAEHPAVLYDTSCFSAFDVVELFARVPAERVVFASDVPYGRPASGLFQALRVAALAGLDEDDCRLIAGGTMAAVLERRPLPVPRPPRLESVRPVAGPLLRMGAYLMMAFGAAIGGSWPPDPAKTAPFIAMARCVARDPAPGAAEPAVRRIDAMLEDAEQLIAGPVGDETRAVFGLLQAAIVIAATEPPDA
ncbi:MAG: hypothetical protein QOE11_2217 [Solirubrobacteraceae bacterium]|jgi:hypothetical protein|nr:hypothetical protein [Solirubrobacteraceae bacterium]